MKILLIILVMMITACSSSEKPNGEVIPVPSEPVEIQPEPQHHEPTLIDILNSMTLQEKIGQLFIIRPEALDFSLSRDQLEDLNSRGVTQLSYDLINTLKDYPMGGFILFDKNIVEPKQLKELIHQLNENLRITPFISVDEEGGLVSRIANNPNFEVTQFPNMIETQSTHEATQIGITIGSYLKELGFNLDFAPVADVNSNPNNPVIGPRSFSEDPQIVSLMIEAITKGFHQSQMIVTLKHFPGHGDTQNDSHEGLVSTNKTLEELNRLEFLPFRAGIKAGADLVMMAHILTPSTTSDNLPASLSKEMHNILRNELGFEGLIISDSLSMKAISDNYSVSDAVLLAYESGTDLLLMPANLKEAFDTLETKFVSGELDRKELDQRVLRILKLKLKYHLIDIPSLVK